MSIDTTGRGLDATSRADRSYATPALLEVLSAVAPYVGQDFFNAVTLAIAETCGVKAAFVCELLLDLDKARTVAAGVDGQTVEPIEYSLPGSPCREAVIRGRCAYPEDVTKKFPGDYYLAELGAETYAGVLLRSSSGDPLGLLSICHDAPTRDTEPIESLLEGVAPRVAAELERRQREIALRRSEARFRLLAEYSKDILFYYQLLPQPSFEYISPAVEEIVGHPPEAFHANPELATQLIHPEDRPQVMNAIASGDEEPILARLVRPDGKLRWIEYRNFPLRDSDDRLVAVGGSIRDITRRVEAEENLRLSEQYRRALLGAMPDTLFRVNAAGVFLDHVSGDGALEILPSTDAVVGRNIADALPAGLALPIKRLIPAALRSGRLQRLELEVSTGTDSKFYEARCLPFGSDEVLLILRDFTAIKWHEAEEERRRLRDELDVKVEERIRTNPYGLTYREFAVLHLVAEGSADKQIAESLGISIYTVNKHVGNILGKMNAASRTEAGVRALREGLLG